MTIAQQVAKVVARNETKAGSIAFLNFALASALEPHSRDAAGKLFAARWPRSIHRDAVERHVKAAVTPGSTTNSPLVELQPLAAQFIEYLRPRTIIGQMADSMRRVPFQIRVPRVTSGASAHWIGQARIKAASSLALDVVELPATKVCTLVIISKDLAKLADPSVEALIRTDMTAAIAAALDTALLDPSLVAVPDQSPASITNGSTEVTSSGVTATAVVDDLRRLFASVTTLTAPFLIMKPTTAVWLASVNDGQTFRDIGANGGTLWGTPVVTSANSPSDANSPSEKIITLLDASEILLAEGRIVEIKSAGHATIEMSDTPDSPATASTTMVSLWQHDLLGLMCEQFIGWVPRQAGAVAYLSGLPY